MKTLAEIFYESFIGSKDYLNLLDMIVDSGMEDSITEINQHWVKETTTYIFTDYSIIEDNNGELKVLSSEGE